MSSSQLSEWEAYYSLSPSGEDKEDFRIASLCSIITNIAIKAWGSKGSKLTTPKDFMPDWAGEKKKGQSIEEMKAVLLSIAAKQNKKVEVQNKLKEK